MAVEEQQDKMIVFRNGRIWDGENFFEGSVAIEDGKVSQIGEIRGRAELEFDAAGKIISAGLVDIHTHLRGVSCAEFGVHGESVCFPFGVVAAADAACIADDKGRLDSFALKTVVFALVDCRNNRADFTRAEAVLKRVPAVGLKLFFGKESPDIQDAAPLREVCEYGRLRNLRVMVHAANPPVSMSELLDCLNEGDICTHAFHGTGRTADEDGFQALKNARKRGVIVDVGMAGGVHIDFSVARKAVAAGISPDTISTDITRKSAFIRGGVYGMTLAMSAMRTSGMDERDIFRAVTSKPSEVLGKGDSWGRLKIGGAADVAVLEYSDCDFSFKDKAGNILQSDRGYRCLLTVADGQIVHRDVEFRA